MTAPGALRAVVSTPALMCSQCLMTHGRPNMLLRAVESAVVVFDGESLCLDHAEDAQAQAICDGRYRQVGGTEHAPEFERVRE